MPQHDFQSVNYDFFPVVVAQPAPPPSLVGLRAEMIGDVAPPLVADAWNSLAHDVPFRRWDWNQAWARHFGSMITRPWVISVRDQLNRLVGVAPWRLTRSRLRGRVVSFLGSGEVCSDYLSLLAAAEHRQAVAHTLVEWLSGPAAKEWDLLEFDGVAADDPAMGALLEALAERGYTKQTFQPCSAWRLELPGTWNEYLDCLSRSRRDKVRQLTRKLLDTGLCVPKLAKTESEMEFGWRVLCDLHQRRRQSLGEPGCFASPRFAAFHEEVVRRLFADGKLRLHWIEYEGKPVAAEYGITGGSVVYAYQCGLDPDHPKLKAGWLNTIASLKLAIEQGFRGFDWLRGDEPYKASWRATPRPLVTVTVVGRGAGARMRHKLFSAGQRARRWLSCHTRRKPAHCDSAEATE
jgi:CelD/BcsL family acetyltransferase involved in cellulose biosynthesis